MKDDLAGGVGLIEVYDVDDQAVSTRDRIVNISTRGEVEGGRYGLIGGFVITGSVPKKVLIRGVGPTLGNYGVSSALKNPVLLLDLHESGQSLEIAQNDDWGAAPGPALIREASVRAGSFPLLEGDKDAAILVWLKPGVYTATVMAEVGDQGIALIEVYEVD